MKRDYFESATIVTDGPFGGHLIRAEGALCVDGVRRNAHPSHDGIADTFFSIPAYVHVKHKRVYGYVTIETLGGNSVVTDADPATVKFFAYSYRKNHGLIVDPDAHAYDGGEIGVGPCEVCGGSRRAPIHAVEQEEATA